METSLENPQQTSDLIGMSDAQRREVSKKLMLLKRWREALEAARHLGFKRDQGTAQFLNLLSMEGEKEIGRRTLCRWESQYRQSGVAGLADGRSKRNKPARGDDRFFEKIKDLFLRLRGPNLKACFQMAVDLAMKNGWPTQSYGNCARRIGELPRGVVVKARYGSEAHNNYAQPYIERDYSTLESNEIWCGDHHQFDVVVIGPGGQFCRPWITAWEDMRSRKIVGWAIFHHDPNQDTILATFADAAARWGVPLGVYIDNGKDYDSYALNGRTKKDRWRKRRLHLEYEPEAFGGVFGELGIKTIHCEPYHGQSKPIERFFLTLEERFCKIGWPTYIGRTPFHRPVDFQLQIERGNAPTLEYFTESFARWIQADYHAKAHTGDAMNGQSPDAVYAACLHTKRVADPALLELLTLKRTKPVKVGRNGVLLNGIRYGQYSPQLTECLGREVILRYSPKPGGLQSVSVFTADDRTFICHAAANQRLPANASSQDLREAMAEKRRHRKLMSGYFQTRPRMHEDLPDLLYQAMAAKNAARPQGPAPEPPKLKPIRHRLEGQLPAFQTAYNPLRKAVGSELTSEPTPKLSSLRTALGMESFCFIGPSPERLRQIMTEDDQEASLQFQYEPSRKGADDKPADDDD